MTEEQRERWAEASCEDRKGRDTVQRADGPGKVRQELTHPGRHALDKSILAACWGQNPDWIEEIMGRSS